MAWEDFLLTEYVHRKSREKDGKLEFIEVKKIYKNEEISSIKLVIGDLNVKKEIEMTVNEWKALLIFFNNIKTRIEPPPIATPITVKHDELIEEPVEVKVPVMPGSLAKQIEELAEASTEFKTTSIALSAEERVVSPSLSIAEIVDSIEDKIESIQEESIAEIVDSIEDKIESIQEESIAEIVDSIEDKTESIQEESIEKEIEVEVPELGIDKIEAMIEQADIKSKRSIDSQKELDSQIKIAEKEAKELLDSLETKEAPLSPEMLDFNRAIAEKSKKNNEIKEEKREISEDLSKNMKILGFHEPESTEKAATNDIKIQLPTLKSMPEPSSISTAVKTPPHSIDVKTMGEIEKLFPELKEEPSSIQKPISEKIIDLGIKETQIKSEDISDQIIKKAISIQNELEMDDEERAKKLKNAMEEVALVMPEGPARDFVNYMLEKRKTTYGESATTTKQKIESKSEIDIIQEEIELPKSEKDEIKIELPKSEKDEIKIELPKSEKDEIKIELPKSEKDEIKSELPKLKKDESKVIKEPELIVEDVPSIWELMEEKEKIDHDLKTKIEQENEKLSFTIAVSSENELESGKTKEKKLRFW
ncbi:MAG: hypothetical protein EAX96_02535 [Candidatus Lokiarchaeota archaeon]|nr:hypothetical protein [Candidatus Lokiarchaeota archaeon]